MANPDSIAVAHGRLASDPKVFTNKDGSKKVMFTAYVDRGYTNRAGERVSDALPFEAFVRAETDGVGPFAHIHKGDRVGINYEPRMNVYQKNGETVYELKLEVQDISFRDSRSESQARLAERVNKAEAENQQLAQPAPAAAAPAEQGTAVQATEPPF